MKTKLILAIAAAMMVGCSDHVAETYSKMDEIKQKPSKAIEAIPESPVVQPIEYLAFNGRSALMSERAYEFSRNNKPVYVSINPNRSKQPLESFSLEELKMHGVISKGKGYDALMLLPDENVVVIGIGDYLGENHGRVTEIRPDGLDLVEAIPDGMGRYIERKRVFADSSQTSESAI